VAFFAFSQRLAFYGKEVATNRK